MNIEGSVVLVTGANRGIGAEWVRQLHQRGRATEVVVDDVTRFVKSTLTEDPSRYAAILGGGQ